MTHKRPIVFVHVPKTAGTSFRKSLDKRFSSRKGLLDYGKSYETSDAINQLINQDQDYWGLANYVSDNDISFLSGHFPASKYVSLFGANSMATFVREPLERLFSEYIHFKNYKDCQDSFHEFASKPVFINRQKRMLDGVPIPAFGFIGLTSDYSKYLKTFNKRFKTDLNLLSLNKRIAGSPDLDSEVTAEELEQIKSWNKADIRFYADVLKWLKVEQEFDRDDPSFVRGEMAAKIVRGKVHGWAIAGNGRNPAQLECFLNRSKIGECVATRDSSYLRKFGLARNGFAGFEFDMRGFDPVKNDIVEINVAGTGQPIFRSSLVI